jgi:hypothetical protein
MMINGTGAQRVPYNSPLEQQGRWLHRSDGDADQRVRLHLAARAFPACKGVKLLMRHLGSRSQPNIVT